MLKYWDVGVTSQSPDGPKTIGILEMRQILFRNSDEFNTGTAGPDLTGLLTVPPLEEDLSLLLLLFAHFFSTTNFWQCQVFWFSALLNLCKYDLKESV